MKIFSVTLLTFLLSNISFSQDLSKKYAKYIDTSDLRKHLSVLASDEYEGRETGTSGQKQAAAYLKSAFQEMDCGPVAGKGYFQEFKLLEKKKSGKIETRDQTLNFPQDFGFNGLYQTFRFEMKDFTFVSGEKLFGSSVDYSNKFILVEIESYKSFTQDVFDSFKCKGIVFMVKNYDSRYFTSFNTDNLAMIQKDPKTPYLFLNRKSFSKKFLKKLKSGEGITFSIDVSLNENPAYVSTENVIAFVEGSDPILKEEIIVISAHYDHIGIENGKIFNGADDNGSGTSGLLEIAEAFQQAKKSGDNPKRSVMFIALTGEEMGLFGSGYYTTDPFLPLNQTITDLNIDMIGRTTKESEKDTFSVYVIGSNMLSDDLHNTQELANTQFTHLDLDYKYNNVNDPLRLYYRSDHYNFAKNGIPSIFYFGGFHDDYHKETDEISKINFEKIRQISTLVFHTAWMLGNAESRPKLN